MSERRSAPHPDHAVYAISVAAELSGVGVQSLRLYEAHGLVTPRRTSGGTRRYSSNDVERVGRISDLLAGGLNLAGISMVLALESENGELRTENAELRAASSGRRTGHVIGQPAGRSRIPLLRTRPSDGSSTP